jgi:hypothetical protein
MPNLFRFLGLLTLFIMLSMPAFAASSADLQKEADRNANAYLQKMGAKCNGAYYFKANREIRELRGKLNIGLHEPPYGDIKKGIEWSCNYEISAKKERAYSRGEGWSEPPIPVLFFVEKVRGKWRTSGLKKITCDEVNKLRAK